ncbi:sugar transferase [[Clostridium] innocuum]|nr:sugar transferase [[Clostridium] innocuum]
MRMLLKPWDEIPSFMKNDEVKKYYDSLSKKKLNLVLKRLYDITVSFFLLVILSPVFMILAIWIKADSKGTVFYRQERITQYGKVFRIFKFRTMVSNADRIGSLVTMHNDSRITRVGEKIRKCRLDEIPQLINILLGDMSFVGTRPEVKKYVEAYTNEMKATLLLPAGVTSLTSINFRNEDEILENWVSKGKSIDQTYVEDVLPEKMKFNLEYLEQFNILKDVNLCVKTII